jgi:hypothetical protein
VRLAGIPRKRAASRIAFFDLQPCRARLGGLPSSFPCDWRASLKACVSRTQLESAWPLLQGIRRSGRLEEPLALALGSLFSTWPFQRAFLASSRLGKPSWRQNAAGLRPAPRLRHESPETQPRVRGTLIEGLAPKPGGTVGTRTSPPHAAEGSLAVLGPKLALCHRVIHGCAMLALVPGLRIMPD